MGGFRSWTSYRIKALAYQSPARRNKSSPFVNHDGWEAFSGFKDWQRKLKVSSGSSVHLSAELEKTTTP
jgi:hypothetical protein